MSELNTLEPLFFLSKEKDCPYLPNRQERKIYTVLSGEKANRVNQILTRHGFRRSQSIAYRPACANCSMCQSVRIVAPLFQPSRRFKRIVKKGRLLEHTIAPLHATKEQFALFHHYVTTRHSSGGMSDMTSIDYALMIEECPVDAQVHEYRLRHRFDDLEAGALVACSLTDRINDGLSMVYSFYNPELSSLSLGSFMILDHIAQTRALGLEYVYLGYWVKDCDKMAYKKDFMPLEILHHHTWEPFDNQSERVNLGFNL